MRLYFFLLLVYLFDLDLIKCRDKPSEYTNKLYQTISPQLTLIPPNRLNIKFNAFSNNFSLDLEEKSDFISDRFLGFRVVKNTIIKAPKERHNRCYYRGNVSEKVNSWVALSYCDKLLNGVFEADGVVYRLRQSNLDDQPSVEILITDDHKFACGFNDSSNKINQRKRRDVYGKDDLNTIRYVEMVLVNDYDIFKFYGRNSELIYNRNKELINIVNALYEPLNIKIALTGSIIWTDKNEIDIIKDSSQTLTNFLKYRKDVLIRLIPNDNAQLITNSSFESGIVGKALKQTICSYDYSGGINSDYSKSLHLLATTIAHELGHNFGMEHDNKDCVCPNEATHCIMGPSSSHPSPKYWSSCSVSQLRESFAHGMDLCLLNKPKTLFRPNCGNGILDDGEECDCGLPEFCKSKCCDPLTCKLTQMSECSDGDCCDKKTCKIISKSAEHICRKANSVCEMTQECDGFSEHCPKKKIVKDGTECLEGYAYCYSGKCDYREKQCKLLWGESGEVADYRCFQHNINASSSGDCGYDKEKKRYLPCQDVKDIICGRLHCTRLSDKLSYGPEGAAIISKSIESRKGKKIFCHSAIIDLGLNERDPGLVPNGAKCGPDSMCVDQRCVSTTSFLAKNPCPNGCSNNGYCDNEGKCSCFENYNSYDCSSYKNGMLTLSFYFIFFVLLPIGTIVIAIFYYNKQHYFVDWINQRSFTQDYNNKRQKKQPRNFEITLPLERRNDNEHANTTPAILKPIRPAPPKPTLLFESTKQNETTPKILNRSKMPPPPKPPQIECDTRMPLQRPFEKESKIKDLVSKFERN